MNLSMKWLRDYVQTGDMSPRAYCEGMTMSGSKVEGYEIEGQEIQNVVVGQVTAMERHPDSDHMWICQVNLGDETVQIVTGAQNVSTGDFVPVAKHKSVLPGGHKITKGKLRGVESNGMLCSLGELGLTAHDFPYAIEDGIFILGEDCDRTLGLDIQTAIGLDDTTVEFEITSNRPDCFSILGLARETAATFDLPMKTHIPQVKGQEGDVHDYLQVEVKNGELCPRYMARVVKNVRIAPSPRWMRERLRACGVRPINNIVDITNFVMLEYGQPMHAFDLKYVDGAHIIVRNAAPGEQITTLDGVERKLSPEMLVIADQKNPTAIAGVMGGEYSEIQPDTVTIAFESACFKGSSVRTTAKKVGLRTEASGRYEKGLDPATCEAAVNRACELVELLDAGEVVGGTIDIDNASHQRRRIPFTAEWVNRFLGINLAEEEMARMLQKLEIPVENGEAVAPTWRPDLESKADIAEEIARMYGYDKIPTTALRGTCEGVVTPRQKFDRRMEQTLLGLGMSEIYTFTFISPKLYDKIKMPADSPLRRSVTIQNPLGEDTSILRTTALPSMLQVLATNYNNRNPEAALYEVAQEFLPTQADQLPEEKPGVILGAYGEGWDFYALKGRVEALLEKLGVHEVEYRPCTHNPAYHPGRCAAIVVGEETIGGIGEIHPEVCENFEIGTKVYAAQLDGNALFRLHSEEKSYTPMPRFPASTRDLAVICDEALPVAEIEKAIRRHVGKLLEKVQLFDVYRGAQIPAGKKSVAYALILRAADRTLTVEECDKAMAQALEGLKEVGAEIRSTPSLVG
ncbi:MAG: phenylalanine--tRNA ligase subunit beta [Angelakisella sp.]|jgi:phenylalanyl-tRNA synthetase beta chain|nr:phenylalanine--tRNA ligase subunit beta [Angelakisella sp.]